jgi:hypothetical protein
MALKCKNVFSGQTLAQMESLGLTETFDKNVDALIKQFVQVRQLDATTSNQQIISELKNTQASELLEWRSIVDDKYPEAPTAYEYILNEAVESIQTLNNKNFNKKLPAIVNSIKTSNQIKETRDWFMSADFEKAAKSAQYKSMFGLYKNAIRLAKDGDDTALMEQIFLGLLANNNFQKGTGFEDLRSSNMAKYFWNGVEKELNAINPKWSEIMKNNKETMIKFYEDKQNIARTNGAADKSLSDDGLHWTAVSAMKKHFKQIQADNNIAGGDMNFLHFADRVMFNPLKLITESRGVQKIIVDQETFANELADALDPGSLKQLKAYENLSYDEIAKLPQDIIRKELKYIGNQMYESTTKYAADDLNKEGRVSPYLLFKDGASELAIRNKYTSQDPVNAIYSQFMRFSEENAKVRLYGTNLKGYINELRKTMDSDPDLRKHIDTNGWSIFTNHLMATERPSMINKTQTGRFFTTMRNINVGHLGFIPMDQTLVEPFFAISRMNRTNKKWFRNMKTISGHHPLLTSKQNRAVAQHWGIATEHIIGMTQMRLYNTMASSLAEGDWQRWSEKIANGFMRYTGSTFLSDGQAAGGLAVLRTNVGTALKSGAKWKKLSETNPDWIRELKRHGFTEQDYDQTVRLWNTKDQHGKSVIMDKNDGGFDIFKLADYMDRTEAARGGLRTSTLYDKWHKFFNSNVDGLSRIRPGDMEKMRLSFFTDDTNWSQATVSGLLKTITQFKSFSFAVGRRMHGKELQDGGTAGMFSAIASVLAYTFVGAIAYTQAKEIVNGNNMYSFLDSKLYERALTRLPILGNLAVIPLTEMVLQNTIANGFDVASELGAPVSSRTFTERDFSNDLMRQFLGPVLSGLADLTTTVLGSNPIEKPGKTISNITDDLVALFGPSIIGLNLFKFFLTDAMEEALDPDKYYNSKARKEKYAYDERRNGYHNVVYEKLQSIFE